MESKKKIRITKQLNAILTKCSDAEIEICTAYYVPNKNEIEEYLKQGDYNTQLENLLSGNNPLVRRMSSSNKQQEFTNLMNNSLKYEMGLEKNFNSKKITMMILNQIAPIIQPADMKRFEELIESDVIPQLRSRVKSNVENNKSNNRLTIGEERFIASGIENILKARLKNKIGLTESEYNLIDGGINSLAQNIKDELKEDGFIIRKIDLSSNDKLDDLNNIKKDMLNDPTYLSQILPIPKEKHIPIEVLIQRVINSIMYKSASNPYKIEVHKLEGYMYINGEVLPISLYEKILDILGQNIGKAFRNINMYLTSSDTIFTDEFYRKYILHLDDTHILGIEKTSNFLITLVAKKIYDKNTTEYNNICAKIQHDPVLSHLSESDLVSKIRKNEAISTLSKEECKLYLICKEYLRRKPICDNIENKLETIKTLNIPRVNPPALIKGTRILFNTRFERISPVLSIYNHLYRLSDEVPNTEQQIEAQISHINAIQKQINAIMSDQKESKIFERLVYFLIKDSNNPLEVLHNTDEKQLNDIFKNNMCVFSNEYYINFKNNPTYFINKISEFSEERIIKIKSKYDEIFEIQNYLDYKYKIISQSIIKNLSYKKWEQYFSGKHDNEKGELKNDRLGPFGIAQLLLENEVKEHQTSLTAGTDITNSIFNLFKVDDKTYYIINFNYVTDLNRIFIIDSDKAEREHHIICEMEALDERLVAYCHEVNENGVARFYSAQNTEDILIDSFIQSHLNDVIDFKGKEYSTILVFAETSEDQRITQHYTSARGTVVTVNNFVNYLLNNKIELRRATALNVEGDYSQDTKKSISDLFQRFINRQRILSKTEMNELSIIGCSNADYMIEHLTIDEVKKFVGIDNINNEELELIKTALKLVNLKSLNKELTERKEEQENLLSHCLRVTLPQVGDNSNGQSMTERKRQLKEEIQELEQLIHSNENYIRVSEEVLTHMDHNRKPIPLNDIQGIKTYFENNMVNLIFYNTQVAKYLAERASSLGDLNFSKKIKEAAAFGEYVNEKIKFFKKEYKKHYTIYLFQTGSKSGQALVPVTVSTNNKIKSLEIFDREMLPLKNAILDSLSQKIVSLIPDVGEDKYRYLELADKELSSIIQIRESKTAKTIFEQEIEERYNQKRESLKGKVFGNYYVLNLTIKSLIVNDSMTLEDKVAKIVKASKDYIAEVESWKEEYSFDGRDEIQKYHFSKDEIAKQAYYSEHKYDIFNSIYERKCNITEIVECILRKLQDTIMSIYNEYVNNGNVLYEYEMPQSETALNYINNQKYYRERVSSKVNACVLAIHKLYNEMVKYNSAIDNNKKEIIAEIIENKMLDVKGEIDKSTKNNAFILGTNALAKRVWEDGTRVLSEYERESYKLMAIDGETVVMPKI